MLKPLVQYKGKTLDPASGAEQNFSMPKVYTVSSWDNSATKRYTVTVTTKGANTDTGIFDYVITNVPKAKVVIGTRPRADGKIPIVVLVPYRTEPLTTDGLMTDLMRLIPAITLSNAGSKLVNPADDTQQLTINPDGTIVHLSPNVNGPEYIPFGNQGDYQEADYRVKAEGGNTQDYVVMIARDVQYYYVKANGNDIEPNLFNGSSESNPFKTLAWAVNQAVKHEVDHIFVIGTLNETSEGGAYEVTYDTSVTFVPVSPNTDFQSTGGAFLPTGTTGGGASVFNLNGTGIDSGNPYHIYITGVGSNAVLQGTSGKRVISITGGAYITFENITIQGGGSNSYTGNGGGIYIGGNSTVNWKSGSIINNSAVSGGGVYVEGSATPGSEFDLITGTISGNTATGAVSTIATIDGGGGVYVKDTALFWMADGTISNNTTKGSGGGVLVNGGTTDGFLMSAGSVRGNNSSGNKSPHGGGGVYVAQGAFEMLNGEITQNKSTRQGGGVFVWSGALFNMIGNSSISGNDGVGSSKSICSRGITEMRDNARADKVYIWHVNSATDRFTISGGARIGGLVLAFADEPKDNRNFITIAPLTPGTDPITTIDLESHLTPPSYAFAKDATINGDWLNNYLVFGGSNPIDVSRFPLGTFTSGGPAQSISSKYKLDANGKLQAK
jgi:hypothetical protein